MKTAILISGHMRSFDKCLLTQHWHVFRHFPDADFFVSTVKDDDAAKAGLLRVKYPKARVEIEVVDEQPDCVAEMRAKGVELPAEWHKGRPYTHEPYAISVHPQGVLRQLWQLQKCWGLMVDTTPIIAYDVIIRCRPDLRFHSCEIPSTIDFYVRTPQAFVPWWGSFGGVNDRFAILSQEAACSYFATYSKTPELMGAGCPLHPESLVAASLKQFNCDIRPLLTEFSTLRTNGDLRRWESEVSPADMARLSA